MKKHLLGLLAALNLAACAANPATGGNMFTLVGKEGEREIGEATATAQLKRYGMYRPSSVATGYIQDLCTRIWATTEAASDPVSCLLLDDGQFNAWATPGYVSVNRGLLPYVHSEAELVAVIGHEAGHVTARHVAQRVTSQQVAGILVGALGIYVASQSENGVAAQTAMSVGSVAAGLGIAAYGRSHENEADGLGQRYMERLGYDPREAVSMVRAMLDYEAYQNAVSAAFNGGQPDEGPGRWTRSHPPTAERIERTAAKAGEPDGSVKLPQGVQPATTQADPQGRVRYLKAINGVEYGPQRKFGVAGKDYIALPKQRFVLQLPQGFITRYEENAKADVQGLWQAVHPQSGVVVGVEVGTFKAGMNAAHALEEIFSGITNVRGVTVAGRQAYIGNVKKSVGGDVRRAIAMPMTETDSLMVIGIIYPSAQSAAAEETAVMDSIARSVALSESGARQYRQLEIAYRTIGAGDTLERLAMQLPQGALQQQHLMALNGWTPDTPLIPGMPYKTLVDLNPK